MIYSVFTSKIYNEICSESEFNPLSITAIKQKDVNKILDIFKQDINQISLAIKIKFFVFI